MLMQNLLYFYFFNLKINVNFFYYKENEGSWVKHHNNEIVPLSETAWKDGEPNGLQYENCAMIEFDGMADIDCLTRVQCAVCEFRDQAS